MRAPSLPTFLGVTILLLPAGLPAQQPARFRSLAEALSASALLAGESGPVDVRWIEGGRRFSYTRQSSSGAEEIRAFEPATQRDSLLFTTEGTTFPETGEPFSYDSFQWARDSRHLVFQTRFRPLYRRSGIADYHVYSLADHSMKLAARDARTAELSPDGGALAYERNGDLFTYDVSRGIERRLTNDARELVYNGHFDWVYEEEFSLTQAWSWSPDSRHIAYWQVDERAEPVVRLTDYEGTHPDWWTIRIPQPGDSNPVVRIGVVDVRTGSRTWLDTGQRGDFYIPRIYWTSHADTLAVVTLNRPQNDMTVFFFDVTTGGRRLVLRQTSDTWIDVYDFYADVQDLLTFPMGIDEFFWVSDGDGWQHIYRYSYTGKLINQVTRGNWSVTRIEGVDVPGRTIYYTSTEASPLQRQLYAVPFDGKQARRLTRPPGEHQIDLAPDGRYYIDRWSSTQQPLQVELWTTAGRMVTKLEDNATVSAWLRTQAYAPVELFGFTTQDGIRLDASMIKPVPFDSTRRYPVVMTVYGGPGSQEVYDAFGTSGWAQWLAQQGYVVVDVNNRGSNNYGSAFMKVVYQHLGKWESHDFAETARYLATLPYVDARRIAITGTSYGAYSAVYTMLTYPDLFTAGIANSTPADWRLYDSIYTERYMGLLRDNELGLCVL